jgi:hypothetical protein
MSMPVAASKASRRGRVDWRFLMPISDTAFSHLVLLGGTTELSERVIETGVATQVSASLPDAQSADAVVVLSGHSVPALDLAKCLKAGGALYYEVDRRLPKGLTNTPSRVRRRLARVGLTPTGVYWAAPNFANCKRYIPLDTPGPLEWYLSALYVAGSPFHRLLEIGMRLCLAGSRTWFASVAPCYAVTAIAGPAGPDAPAINGHSALSQLLAEPGARPMVVTSGQDDGSRTVVLPFGPGRRQPGAVYKVSAHARLNGHTEREQTVLSEIHTLLDDSMGQSVPRPLGVRRLGNLTVSMESCASGQTLVVTSGRWPASFQQQIDDLRLAANWLIKFHRRVSTAASRWDEAASTRWVETPLAAYIDTFGVTPAEEALFAKLQKAAQALRDAPLAQVRMHYDVGPWNLFRDQDQLTVIDWEFGRNWERDRRGPALYDLLYFVIYWYHVVKRLNTEAAELDGLRRLFIEPDSADRHAAAAHRVIAEYMAALDLDARFLPLILVYMWIEQALYRFSRRQSLGEAQPEARAGNRYVRYLGVLARHADQLFAARSTSAVQAEFSGAFV